MKLNKVFSLLLLFILTSAIVQGQSREVRRGNSFYEDGEWFKALELFEEARDAGEDLSVQTQIRIANCYFELNNIDDAFNLFMELEPQLKGQDLFTYAKTTHRFGFYQGAIELYNRCLDQGIGNSAQIQELIRSCEFAIENEALRTDYYVNPSDLATYGQSFGIQYYKDGVVYSSSSGDADELDRYGRAFLNLYYSPIEDGEIQEAGLFSENLVFDYHVGAIAFTSDEETMYYTKSVRVRGGDSRIKIFRVTFENGEWGNEEELSINSDKYDCAYPAVTPDDKYLIFASNMSGGHGGTDLYIAERRGNGRFGQVRNLGATINTFGDERFPFVSKDYKMYFASNGHLGFGGLDIFETEHQGGTTWVNPINLMKPFNSNKDDFGYVIDPNDPQQGFLSSNRLGSGATDAIFYVEPRGEEDETEEAEEEMVPMGGIIYDEAELIVDQAETTPEPEPEPDPVVEVIPEPQPEPEVDLSAFPDAFSTSVNSTFNGTEIPDALVVVRDNASDAVVVRGATDRNGKIHLIIPDEYRKENQSFDITVSKGDEYNSRNMLVDIMELEDIARNGIELTPIFDDAELDDIGTMVIPYRGENITPEGQKVLDQLAVYLKNNPRAVVKLNAHTEARGNKYNNLLTSQKVAEKAEQIMMEKGIDDRNLIPRGYGERYLINKCKRGKLCDESEHLANRRIEVVVWKMLE
ncbi:OmpA family protein [Marinilabilia salmonicolor]|uniref:WD40 repeat protein n=1 Tax=Marinilabilia salmonicolor TaxID=989 RepID=A0A368UQC9_9BACT|nr:OmpA family protein [Marinilabilia salmonicolor]RCW30220.1 WD40 repeat protein [Marinilabilia salmonicolor]